MGCIHDTLIDGKELRCHVIEDTFSPLAVDDRSEPFNQWGTGGTALNQLALTRGLPAFLSIKNGPESICKRLAAWAADRLIT